jgi:hypothetical protein
MSRIKPMRLYGAAIAGERRPCPDNQLLKFDSIDPDQTREDQANIALQYDKSAAEH